MGRSIKFIYSVIAYIIFLVTFLYSIGFIGNTLVPKSIDSGMERPIVTSLVINLALLSVFALQHSIIARPAFKRIWTKINPKAAEQSTYILITCVALILICGFWQPLVVPVWDLRNTFTGRGLTALFWVGWVVVLASTFMIDHLDLFGLKQIYVNMKMRKASQQSFVKIWLYQLVRHPHCVLVIDCLLSFANDDSGASFVHICDHRIHNHRCATSLRKGPDYSD